MPFARMMTLAGTGCLRARDAMVSPGATVIALPPSQSQLRLPERATVPVTSVRGGGGSGCASTDPSEAEGAAAMLPAGGREAKGFDRALSLKRAMSLLQAASPDAISAIGASRIRPRERHDSRKAPMAVLAGTQNQPWS